MGVGSLLAAGTKSAKRGCHMARPPERAARGRRNFDLENRPSGRQVGCVRAIRRVQTDMMADLIRCRGR